MVKADLTRDYYADLGLQPGASDSEIKKQFRQLALKYHPDRNPGREAEVNSKFQTIQSAHEVLTDAEQKAKYDSARLRSNTTRTYSGFGATTTASGTRGNPWSSAGSEWAPPPKPPPPRDAERRKPPPTSAGAARYANFATPNGTAPKATQNAEARRKNYEAWESMRPPQPPPPRAWQPPKPVPKEYTPQSGREESNSKQYAPPPKSSRPGYEEFRAGASSSHSDRTSPSRSYSTRESPRKNGFMPGTPGPDEPPAFNASAYFSRNSRPSSRRQAEAPEPPPREQPPRPAPPIDPLRQFREKDGTPFEPRLSTPYATHGGEKTNPFESINLNRSKSTREPVDNTNSTNAAPSRPSGASERHRSASPPRTRHGRNLSPEPGIARADSDIHLGSSPKRTYSSANKTYLNTESSRPQPRYTPPVEPISSDGDDSDSDKRQTSFGTRSRTFAKRRAAQTNTRPKENQVPSGGPGSSTGENDERPRKPSLAEFQQWWSSSERKRNALNDVLPDGNANRGNGKEDGPSMYANPKPFIILSHSAAKRSSTLPTVVEEQSFLFSGKSFPQISQQFAASSEDFTSVKKQRPNPATPMTYESPPDSPSGASILTPPGALTSFETTQRKVVEGLLGIRSKLANSTCDVANEPRSNDRGGRNLQGKQPSANECLPKAESISVRPSSLSGDKPHLAGYSECLSSWETGSPSYKIRRCNPPCSISFNGAESIRLPTIKNFTKANMPFASSFSFNAGDETLKSRGPTQNAFTSSAENINTTFTPEDWNGKFEAGEHFTNDGANMKGGSRARSGSRPRTRSPVKGRPISRSQPGSARPPVPHIEPEILQPATDSEQPSSSPGGTKFTPEEWARTFKPQNFAPPPFVSSTGGGRSPLRNARRSRTGSSAAKPLNATKTAMASEGDSSDSPLEIGKRTAQPTATSGTNDSVPPAGTDSPNAMDIDPPFHEQSDTPRHPPDNGFMASNDAANEARNVPVEPSRSEWRAGDASGSDIPVPLVPLKQPELPPRTGRRTTKSADEEDFRTNLEDLKNVEPLQHPATGLHSFDDLTSTLPFQSQAASRLTIPRNFSSGELDLPHPPRAPMVPITKATRPSMAQWESYLLAFKTYMAEWDIFNTKMIIHFVARKSQVDRMKLGWLEAFGDSDLEKYREGLVEDFKVRQWWDVACEKHQDAIEKFQFFKGCMREGGPPQRGPTVAN